MILARNKCSFKEIQLAFRYSLQLSNEVPDQWNTLRGQVFCYNYISFLHEWWSLFLIIMYLLYLFLDELNETRVELLIV